DPLAPRGARLPAFDAVGPLAAVLRQQRELDRLEKGDLTHDPVAAAEESGAAGTPAHGKALQPHRVAQLEHLRIGDAGIRHVTVDGARAVPSRSRPRAAAHRLVVAEPR